jgi:Protein of unknown function (DUF2800)
MSYHARVAPSALHLTVPCPGSLQLQERVAPTPTTEKEAEGTLAHLVAMKHAQGPVFAADWDVGRKHKVEQFDLEVDDDMVDGAAIYSEEAQAGGRYEETVAMPDIHSTSFGTPDYFNYIVNANATQLKIVEYKYGHRHVEVFENYQLIAQAAGVARFLQLPENLPVILVVVQPRNYTHGAVRKHHMTVGEVYDFCRDHIAPRVELALGPDPPTYTGRHCGDCRARHDCHTYQTETADLVDMSGKAEIAALTPMAMGQELRILKEAIKRLEGRYSGLYAHADALARAGHRIPFWGFEAGAGRLKWKDDAPVDTVAGMGDLFGIRLLKPTALITPTQAVKAGIDRTIIDKYAHQPSGSMRLVEDDTTRTRKIFGGKRK